MRGFNYKKAVQALNYLASKNGGAINKMKALKLIWLADRLHVRKYGRSITGDEYYALPNGPVPSATRDVLESSDFLDDTASEYAEGYISQVDKYTFKTLADINDKVFSQTDLEILELVFEKYSHLDQFNLSELSHSFPEWKRHESALAKKISSRFRIDQSDFFTDIRDESGLHEDPPSIIELSKQIFEENSKLVSAL